MNSVALKDIPTPYFKFPVISDIIAGARTLKAGATLATRASRP